MEQIGIYKDGQIYDLQTVQELGIEGGEAIKSDGSAHSLEILRHSTAHMMAQAIKELYPEAKFFVGPVVKEGFYYDFKVDTPINDDDLKTIEKKMKDIASSKYPIEKYTATRDEIQSKFKDDELKQAVLSNITDDTLTIYKQGEFEDLCRGPHMPNTRMIRNFKLIRVSKKGGVIKIITPHFSALSSWIDPTHIHHLSYFSFDHFELDSVSHYVGKGVKVKNRKLSFGGGILGLIARLIFKINPRKYEEKYCFIFRASTLTFGIEVL